MSGERIWNFDGIGPVVLIRRRGIRRLSIRINREGRIRLTIPYPVSNSEALDFLTSRMDWVQAALEKMQRLRPPEIVYGEGEIYIGECYRAVAERHSRDKWTGRFEGSVFKIYLPAGAILEREEVQKKIRFYLLKLIKKDAEAWLLPRLKMFSEEYGLVYNSASIGNMRSRWGSCSAGNKIRLSLHLMRVPRELRDMVLLHELVHTLHKNHGPRFHAELARLCPGYKARSKKLNEYSRQIEWLRP